MSHKFRVNQGPKFPTDSWFLENFQKPFVLYFKRFALPKIKFITDLFINGSGKND